MRLLEVIPVLLLIGLSYPLIRHDFLDHRLPNRFTYLAIAVAFATTITITLFERDFQRLGLAVLVSVVTFGLGYLMAKHDLIGMGDIKLLTATNHTLAWFAPGLVLVALTAGLVLGSIYGLVLVLSKKLDWKASIALGPFLLIGFFVTITPQLLASFKQVAESF